MRNELTGQSQPRRMPWLTSSCKVCRSNLSVLELHVCRSPRVIFLAHCLGTPAGRRDLFSRQSSQEQRCKDTPKVQGGTRDSNFLYETAQTIQHSKVIRHESCKESYKREEDIWTHAEELRTQGGKDHRNRKVTQNELAGQVPKQRHNNQEEMTGLDSFGKGIGWLNYEDNPRAWIEKK